MVLRKESLIYMINFILIWVGVFLFVYYQSPKQANFPGAPEGYQEPFASVDKLKDIEQEKLQENEELFIAKLDDENIE